MFAFPERGYFTVEARWEKSHQSPAHEKFFMIDQIGGSIEDAKSSAQNYFDKHVASSDCSKLTWVEGILRGGRCYYALTPFISFRILP